MYAHAHAERGACECFDISVYSLLSDHSHMSISPSHTHTHREVVMVPHRLEVGVIHMRNPHKLGGSDGRHELVKFQTPFPTKHKPLDLCVEMQQACVWHSQQPLQDDNRIVNTHATATSPVAA